MTFQHPHFPSISPTEGELVVTWIWFGITLLILFPTQIYYLYLYYDRSNVGWFDNIDFGAYFCCFDNCVSRLTNIESSKETEEAKFRANAASNMSTEISQSNSTTFSNRRQTRGVASSFLRTRRPKLVLIIYFIWAIFVGIERNVSLLARCEIYTALWFQILSLVAYALFVICLFCFHSNLLF